MSDETEDTLRFFYSGFYEALQRYRRAVIAGWAVVAVGSAGFLVGWDFTRPPGLYHLVLCLGAIAAGLMLVQGNIAALSSYIRVPFPVPRPGEGADPVRAAIEELRQLMKEVDDGGWQEAFAALERIRRMSESYGLAAPESGSNRRIEKKDQTSAQT